MKKKNILPVSLVIPLLMSATAKPKIISDVTGESYDNDCVERIIYDTVDSSIVRTNTNDAVMDVRVDVEYYKMGHQIIRTAWNNTYSLIFRVSVSLREVASYKDGWWLWEKVHKDNAVYLSSIVSNVKIDAPNANFKLIQNFLDRKMTVAQYEPGYRDISHSGNLYATVGGGYGISMYNFFESNDRKSDDNFIISTTNNNLSSSIDTTTKACYDCLDGASYNQVDVNYYGSIVFESDEDPKSVSLSVEAKCGLVKHIDSLSRDQSSDSLTKAQVNNLIAARYSPIKTTYDKTYGYSKTFSI